MSAFWKVFRSLTALALFSFLLTQATGCKKESAPEAGDGEAQPAAVEESATETEIEVTETSEPEPVQEEVTVAAETTEPAVEMVPKATLDATLQELALLKEQMGQLRTLTEELNTAKTEQAEAAKKLADAEASIASLKEEIADLTSQLDTVKGALSDANAALEQSKAVGDSLTAQNEQLKQEVDRLTQLDSTEFARVVDLSGVSPIEAHKEMKLFIERFPNSPLLPQARAKLAELDDYVEEWGTYVERAPLKDY